MFNVGDKVKVSKYARLDEWYDGVRFTEDMAKHTGEIMTITYAEDFDGVIGYILNRYGGCWTEQMLELVEKGDTMFKVGDKVLVKAGLVVDEVYNGTRFIEEMTAWEGVAVVIKSATKDGDSVYYNINEDNEDFFWSDGMFEPFKEEKEMTALEYFKYKARMVKTNHERIRCGIVCSDCLLSGCNNGHNIMCSDFEALYPKEAIAIMKKYAEENPGKTRMQDFLEKYPNAARKKRWNP